MMLQMDNAEFVIEGHECYRMFWFDKGVELCLYFNGHFYLETHTTGIPFDEYRQRLIYDAVDGYNEDVDARVARGGIPGYGLCSECEQFILLERDSKLMCHYCDSKKEAR